MHSLWTRLNAVIFFSLSVLLAMAVTCWFSKYNFHEEPVIKTLQMQKLRSLRNHGGIDRALFSFDLDADFSPCFHWNIFQINAFVVAEYESKKNKINQIVLWDHIIKKKEEAHIVLNDEFVKYGLIDQGNELRNANITLKIMWDNMPITGRIFSEKELESHLLKLPSKYKT